MYFDDELSEDEFAISDLINITEFQSKYACLDEVPSGWTHFNFPQNIQQIRPRAFQNCQNTLLTVLFVNSSLQFIRNEAFMNCTRLKMLNLEDCHSLTSIGKRAFMNCVSLKTITFPPSLCYLKSSCFEKCSKLMNITIPLDSQLISIGAKSFRFTMIDCVEIPFCLRFIGPGAFANTKIRNFSLSSENKNFQVHQSTSLYSSDFKNYVAFAPFGKITTLSLHKNTEYISSYAFYSVNGIMTIVFNEKLKSIGYNAFANTSIKNFDFSKCNDLSSINESAFEQSSLFSNLDLSHSHSLMTIQSYAFAQCSSIQQIIFPESLEEIHESTFAYCKELSKVQFPKDIKMKIILKDSFFNTKIESFYIGKHVDQFDYEFLFSSSELITIVCHSENKFFTSVDGVLYNKNMTSLLLYPQQKSETNFKIPSSVTTISRLSFFGNKFIQSVQFPSKLTKIEYKAFSRSSIKTLSFPPQVKILGEKVFMNCEDLTNCCLQGDFLEIPRSFFKHCKELQTVFLPSSLLSLAPNAFIDCPKISCVKCPYAVRGLLISMGINPIVFTRPCRIAPVMYREL